MAGELHFFFYIGLIILLVTAAQYFFARYYILRVLALRGITSTDDYAKFLQVIVIMCWLMHPSVVQFNANADVAVADGWRASVCHTLWQCSVGHRRLEGECMHVHAFVDKMMPLKSIWMSQAALIAARNATKFNDKYDDTVRGRLRLFGMYILSYMSNADVLLSLFVFCCTGSVVRGYLRHEPVTDRDPTRRKAVMGSLFQSFFTSKSDDALFNRSRSKSKESAGPAITSEMPPPPSVPLENRVSSDSDYVGSPQARLRKRQTTALVDSQRTSTKKKEEYAHDLVHEQPHHQKMGNIFIFNSSPPDASTQHTTQRRQWAWHINYTRDNITFRSATSRIDIAKKMRLNRPGDMV